MTRYPLRSTTHVVEDKSLRIFVNAIPSHWVIREITRGDYGIDCQIEIPSERNEMTGDFLAVQLKGVESVKWKDVGTVRKAQTPPIKTSTARYWLGLPVPVFVFVVDVAAGEVFFTQAQHSLRREYKKLETQQTLSLTLCNTNDLSKGGLVNFRRSYLMQKGFSSFFLYTEELISHALHFADFIKSHRGQPDAGRVAIQTHLTFRSLVQACEHSALYTNSLVNVDSIKNGYKANWKNFRSESIDLNSNIIGYALSKISEVFPAILRSIVWTITVDEHDYWEQYDPIFLQLCESASISQLIGEIELKLQ